ncbi:MAG: type II toxin-antitoxin system MqsR family toxin [Bacteroidales bacterium]|nr:type II toxin-antitoxin system MqsR family toxin [Bacteroidales bacterium]MBS3776266.1 type II toxin-antitoxin system MqsR family toxin [Bacteroidales bacterium]
MFDIIFLDRRKKNTQTLLDLEITPAQRKKIVESIELKDYVEGPVEEELYGMADMWVFGKMVKNKEVYIKVTLGHSNRHVICISFHIAEYPLQYPFKKGEK